MRLIHKYMPLVLCAWIVGCSEPKPTAEATKKTAVVQPEQDLIKLTEEQAKNAALALDTPTERTIHQLVKVNGTLEAPPEHSYSVSLPLGGYIKKTTLIPGDPVTKGGLLATVEDQQYIDLQQNYVAGAAKLKQLKEELNRQQELNATQTTSDKLLQQARAEYDMQHALVNGLKQKLELIGVNTGTLTADNISRTVSLRAPVSGHVVKVNVHNGQYASPTNVLFELIEPGALHVSLQVFERDAPGIKEGQQLNCRIESLPGQTFEARVHFVTPNINQERTTEVHCHLDKKYAGLLPGMYVTAEIQTAAQAATCLPDESIVRWNNEDYLFVEVGERTYKMVKVSTGRSAEGYTTIATELPKGRVVTKNAYTLLMKLKNTAEE